MNNINPYSYDGDIPLRVQLGGKDLTLLYNGIKMLTNIEVGELTLNIIYADSKVSITDNSNNKERIIKEYPIQKMKEAKKEFKRLIKQKSQGKEIKIKDSNFQGLPKPPNKNNFMLVTQLNESLVIYDLRGKEPKEVMLFPNNQYKKARIELLKLEVGSKKSLK